MALIDKDQDTLPDEANSGIAIANPENFHISRNWVDHSNDMTEEQKILKLDNPLTGETIREFQDVRETDPEEFSAVTLLATKGWTLIAPWSNVFKKMRDKIEERMHEICNTRSGRVAKKNMPEYETLRNLLDLVNPFLGISGPTYTESCGIPTTSPKYKLDVKPEQPVEGLHFTPLNRLIQKIPSENWNDTVNNYAKKLRDCLIKEGYLKDANVLQDYISYMNGNNVPMATMDEQEQPEEGLDEEISRYLREDCSADDEPSVSDIARHFAEWGATHLKR